MVAILPNDNILRLSHACAVSQWKSKLCQLIFSTELLFHVITLERDNQELITCLAEKIGWAYTCFVAPFPISEIQTKEDHPRFERSHCWCYTEYIRDGIIFWQIQTITFLGEWYNWVMFLALQRMLLIVPKIKKVDIMIRIVTLPKLYLFKGSCQKYSCSLNCYKVKNQEDGILVGH